MNTPAVPSVLELPADALDAPPAIGSSLGPYQLEKFLGEGTMGRVYLGRHQQLGRQVALKVLHRRHTRNEQLLRRFLQEARTVNHVNHEHIVEVHDFVELPKANLVYCVMEMLHGETLRERAQRQPLTLAQITQIGVQITQALGAAHTVGVVHRDVKPDNIMLLTRGESDIYVKVLDFGVAKLLQGADAVRVVDTQNAESSVGTPRYMSPEQAAGMDVDRHTDIYALGTVLYELLAGKAPFLANTFGQLAADIITQPPPRLPPMTPGNEAITPAMARLVMTCLSKSPTERPATMHEVCVALEHGGIPTSKGVAVPPRLRGANAQSRAMAAAVVTAVLGLVGVLVLVGSSPRESTPHVMAPVAVAPPVEALLVPLPNTKKVNVSIVTWPEGAVVTRTDTRDILGKTPLNLSLEATSEPLEVDLSLPGHGTLTRQLTRETDQRLEVSLVPSVPVRAAKKRKTSKAPVREGVLDAFE